MAKATIRTSAGSVVTVEGESSEVASIITRIEQIGQMTKEKKAVIKAERKVRQRAKAETATDMVAKLKDAGFFNKPRGLSEISERLAVDGVLVPITSLSGVVLSLVRRQVLSRTKRDGRWVYGKR